MNPTRRNTGRIRCSRSILTMRLGTDRFPRRFWSAFRAIQKDLPAEWPPHAAVQPPAKSNQRGSQGRELCADGRNRTAATVASKIFSTKISPDSVFGDKLMQMTDSGRNGLLSSDLHDCVAKTATFSDDDDELRRNPTAVWVELNLSIHKEQGSSDMKAISFSGMPQITRTGSTSTTASPLKPE